MDGEIAEARDDERTRGDVDCGLFVRNVGTTAEV